MTFIELVEKVSASTGIPKSKVKEVLHTTASAIDAHIIVSGGEVKWFDFGKFSQRKTKGGKAFGRNLTSRPTIKFTPYGH
jgi:nucleoid DNA-binding protein